MFRPFQSLARTPVRHLALKLSPEQLRTIEDAVHDASYSLLGCAQKMHLEAPDRIPIDVEVSLKIGDAKHSLTLRGFWPKNEK
jgi:hypothetical protein